MSREMRGLGTLYQRGDIWWIQYSIRGQVFRESSHSSEKKQAEKLLKQRHKESNAGQVIGSQAEKLTLAEMVKALLADYENKGNRSIDTAQIFAKHLIGFFGETERALNITKDRIDQYIAHRRQASKSNGTVNREVSCLRHMFRLMVEAKRLGHDHVPSVTRLQEAEPRQGFLEPAEFNQLLDALPQYLRDPATFLYLTGWRKSAMRSLEWPDCELEFDSTGELTGGTVRLRAAKSKNKKAWRVRLVGELLEVFRRAWANRFAECAYVFHDRGMPIGDFKKAWRTAKRAVGLDGLLVHDLRRSCVRNLVRSGTPETVVMKIAGHATRAMFDRYNITADADLEAAMDRVSNYVTKRAVESPKIVPLKKRSAA
jgi:integrase